MHVICRQERGTSIEGTYVSPEVAPEPKEDNTALIIIAVIVVLILLCCCIAAIFFVGPFLFGLEIGDVFSNIIEGLEMTPVY